jgi:hypothetical protein
MSERFHDSMTLAEGRAILRELVNDGHKCPVCTQLAKVYRRKINSGMARSLIEMYRVGREGDVAGVQGWVHVPTQIGARSREEGKLAYWGLVEEEAEIKREDGGRAGYWRVTARGAQFVRNLIQVPKYARVYDGRCLGLTGPDVSIHDALGTKFNYDELMAGI